MRCPITAGFILIANVALSPWVAGSAVPQESVSDLTHDEMTLLQSGVKAKVSASGNAKMVIAKHRTPLCSEEVEKESCLSFPSDPSLESLHGSTGSLSEVSTSAIAESDEEDPDAALVSLIRQALWLFSLGIGANGVMRWQQQEEISELERKPAVAKRMRKPADAAGAQHNALHAAARDGDAKRCEALIRGAPDVLTAADVCGSTALHTAATVGSRSVVGLLLARRASVDPVNGLDETPLHLAARHGHVEVCEFLVQRGASLHAANAEDQTPLVVAGLAEREAVCRALIVLGADVEGVPEEDLPPYLREVVARGHI